MSLRIIHFSDIHTRLEKNQNTVLNRVKEIVGACTQKIAPDDEILIVVSGDIASTGKKEEYNIFNEAFSKVVRLIKKECNNLQVEIVCVPGNHDCEFGKLEDIELRKKNIADLVSERRTPTDDEISNYLSVQANYRCFESSFGLEKYNDLVNFKDFAFSCGSVRVYLINTAWISQINEKVDQRFFPIEYLNDIDNLDFDLVITVFHHPAHWLHPDNYVEFENRIKSFSDLTIMGHEHRNDAIQISGSDWKYTLREGTELQNPNNPSDSGFSIYEIDNELNSITTYHYNWNGARYSRNNADNDKTIFSRNLRRVPSVYTPNEETKKWLNDLEMNIQHFRADNIDLKSIFVWPDLKVLDNIKGKNAKINSEHYQHIMENSLSLLIGESASGKSTIAKVIYEKSLENGNNCIYINATRITSYLSDRLESIIADAFGAQYKSQDLEEFQQLSKYHKVLIIDNFQDLNFKLSKRQDILKYFCMKFKNVVLFSNLGLDFGTLLADCNNIKVNDIAVFEICPMGNQVRKKFITNWFKLGEMYEDNEDALAEKISGAIKYVDIVLGQYRGILPAYPIQLITILQCQNSTANKTQQISQYGYLYGTLVDSSMCKKLNGDKINLYKGVLSELAFMMLTDKTVVESIISYDGICECVTRFAENMLVPLDTKDFIDVLMETKIIKQVSNKEYKFMYPYIYYYFAGNYISAHISDKDVIKQVEYMCKRLYNEAYGNIMIFVCYFSNSENIIDQILLNSFELFDGTEPYTFGKENSVLQEAYELIDRFASGLGIGSNEEADKNQDKYLQTKDKLEMQDGTVSDDIDVKEIEDDYSEEEAKVTSLYAALKTMSVLGQIIKCYPGSITGKRKVEIISEIHNLGMRTANEFLHIFSWLEQDMVEYCVKRVRNIDPSISASEIAMNVKNLYRNIMVQFVIAMVKNICISFGSELSIPAAEKALSSCTSGKLVLHYMRMYCGHLDTDEIIKEYKRWKDSNDDFAAIALKYLTMEFLRINRCGHRDRERLCMAFGTDKMEETSLLLQPHV